MNSNNTISKQRVERARYLFYGLFAIIDEDTECHSYVMDGLKLPPVCKKKAGSEVNRELQSTWKKKAESEVKRAIRELARGELLGHTPVSGGRGRFQFRTIAMLLWVYQYLNANPDKFDDDNELVDNISIKYNQLSHQGNQIWILSGPLLLVQAARLSQWEWDHHQYCFEYYTARRAWSYLDDMFLTLECEDENRSKVQLQMAYLLRWQTLVGRFNRGSASFGVKELKELYKTLTLQPETYTETLLDCLGRADLFLKKEQSKIEKDIEEYIKRGGNPEQIMDPTLDKDLHVNEYCKEIEDIRAYIENDIAQYKGGVVDHKSNYPNGAKEYCIYSYIRLPQHDCQTVTTESRIISKVVHELPPPSSKTQTLTHYAFDRHQRDTGVMQALFDAKIDLGNEVAIKTKKDKPIILKWRDKEEILPEEHVYRFAINPYYAAKVLFFPELKIDKEDKREPMTFLNWAFTKGKELYGNILPLPLVKRITDLLQAFNLDDDLRKLSMGHYDLRRGGGLFPARPLLAGLFLLSAFSLVGVPPTTGFWGKFLILREALSQDRLLWAGVALATGLLTLYSMSKIWLEGFWKPRPVAPGTDPLPAPAYAAVIALSLVILVVGLYPEPLIDYLQQHSAGFGGLVE